jgi:two-component system phosphate regulon sensor histidine kinase PhoR
MSDSPALPLSVERPAPAPPARAEAGSEVPASPARTHPGLAKGLGLGLALGLGAPALLAVLGLLPGPLAFVLGALTLAGTATAQLWPQAEDAPKNVHSVRPETGVPPPPPPEPLANFDARARSLLDELPDAILVVDAENRMVLANKAARGGVLVDPAFERKYVSTVSTVMRRPAVLEAIGRVRESGKAEKVEFMELVPLERTFEAFVSPLVFASEPQPLVLITLRDLTQIKAVEQMRADFVANASHELRTPLSSLSGFIETLRGHAKDDPVARERFLGIMQEQAGRMRRLIDDLLSLSRIELNEHVPPARLVDLKVLASDVIDAIQPLARDARITIRLVAAPDLPFAIGDRDELVQVVQNLLDNALKYGKPQSEVVVTVEPGVPADFSQGIMVPKPSCAISVRDHGQGIEPQHIPRLTERFYRVDVNQSRDRGGTGLGLAIVKHIVSHHRAKMDIKSEPGRGSVFMVVLPAAEDPSEPPGQRRHTEVSAGGVKKTS